MSKLVDRIVAFVRREPAILISLAAAAVGVGADFGLHLSASQQRGVYGAVATVAGFLIRSQVTPTLNVAGRLAALETVVAGLSTGNPSTAVAGLSTPQANSSHQGV